MSEAFIAGLYVLSVILAVYLSVKYFTTQGIDVDVNQFSLILVVSCLPFVGLLTGLVTYLAFADTNSRVLFKGEKR